MGCAGPEGPVPLEMSGHGAAILWNHTEDQTHFSGADWREVTNPVEVESPVPRHWALCDHHLGEEDPRLAVLSLTEDAGRSPISGTPMGAQARFALKFWTKLPLELV